MQARYLLATTLLDVIANICLTSMSSELEAMLAKVSNILRLSSRFDYILKVLWGEGKSIKPEVYVLLASALLLGRYVFCRSRDDLHKLNGPVR